MKLFWSVAIGAAVGGVSRVYLATFIEQRAGSGFPLATLVINVSGSILLGFIMRMALQSDLISVETRVMLSSGFCGGFTTFSTFSYETAMLLEGGAYRKAALYIGASVVVALLGTFAGFAAANRFLAFRQPA